METFLHIGFTGSLGLFSDILPCSCHCEKDFFYFSFSLYIGFVLSFNVTWFLVNLMNNNWLVFLYQPISRQMMSRMSFLFSFLASSNLSP